MNKKELIKILKKVWYFIWEDNSIWSWIVNIILAFILIKFVVYPAMGFVFGTTHPVVAVMSGSMEHKITQNQEGKLEICGNIYGEKHRVNFDYYWNECGYWYTANANITKQQFSKFPFKSGFNTADIMVVISADESNIDVGDIVVYWVQEPVPVIHRVINKWEENGEYFITTKGDHNSRTNFNEKKLNTNQLVGKAVLRIPYLGWVKIGFVKFMKFFGVTVR